MNEIRSKLLVGRWSRALVLALGLGTAAATLVIVPPTAAAASQTPDPTPATASVDPKVVNSVPTEDRSKILGQGWRTSSDQAWTTSGDASGFHVLVAAADEGYAWKNIASFGDPSVETDRWVGQACTTESGRRLMVTYAPRTATNNETLMSRGARSAVVDLKSGKITYIDLLSSLEYYNPGCGTGEKAVLTQSGDEGLPGTRLLTVNTTTGEIVRTQTVSGQVTSAIPDGTGTLGVSGGSIFRWNTDGDRRLVTKTSGAPSRLHREADGALVFLDSLGQGRDDDNQVKRFTGGRTATLATAPNGGINLRQAIDRQLILIGPKVKTVDSLPESITTWPVDPQSTLSTNGEVAVTRTISPQDQAQEDVMAERAVAAPTEGSTDATTLVSISISETKRKFEFQIPDAQGAEDDPITEAPSSPSAEQRDGATTRAMHGDQSPCAVARNDPNQLAYQPTPRQVEWAVDQAVQKNLLTARPANWKNLGMSSYSPQVMFPAPALSGGGSVPAALMLGLLSQESNMWQASNHVIPGETGNPLIGNYYGTNNTWDLDWSKADCGYGVGQVTDGMRKSDIGIKFTAAQQKAIALDYEANIAASLQILVSKWNLTYQTGMKINDGNPARMENWFYALWAYNSGFYPEGGDSSGAWGVGWFNNPVNPRWDQARGTFLDPASSGGAKDAAHPQDWPYSEKVLGFAAQSIAKSEFTWQSSSTETTTTPAGAGFRPAWWPGVDTAAANKNRSNSKPPIDAFCNSSNYCSYSSTSTNCTTVDSKCWYHQPVTWKTNCSATCGYDLIRFNTTYAEPGDGIAYVPSCTLSGLPSGALVVDDVPNDFVSPKSGCGHPWTNAGTFDFEFGSDSTGQPTAQIDTHQVGGGFGGHYWFAHTRDNDHLSPIDRSLEVTGSWNFSESVNSWGRVMVHIPDHGADTQRATYRVDTGSGTPKYRTILQRTEANGWVNLGVFAFNGKPKITLTNFVGAAPLTFLEGKGGVDVAWDAAAIVPLSTKPKDFVVVLGDSYSSGEGASPDGGGSYYRSTNVGGNTYVDPDDYKDENDAKSTQNSCHRSRDAWGRKASLNSDLTRTIGQRADANDPTLDFQFAACSGAMVRNILSANGQETDASKLKLKGISQYATLPQLDQGLLDENTTVVALSVGGNDARFGPVLSQCDLPLLDCWNNTIEDDDNPLSVAEPALIQNEVQKSIGATLVQINRLAPNAKIVLMGYPHILAPGAWEKDLDNPFKCTLGIGPSEMKWITQMTDLMNDEMADTADQAAVDTGASITFADPRTSFGDGGACGGDLIHDEILFWKKTDGERQDLLNPPVSQQSFHPSVAGASVYALVFSAALRRVGE